VFFFMTASNPLMAREGDFQRKDAKTQRRKGKMEYCAALRGSMIDRLPASAFRAQIAGRDAVCR
jgi:hypothetical protein